MVLSDASIHSVFGLSLQVVLVQTFCSIRRNDENIQLHQGCKYLEFSLIFANFYTSTPREMILEFHVWSMFDIVL